MASLVIQMAFNKQFIQNRIAKCRQHFFCLIEWLPPNSIAAAISSQIIEKKRQIVALCVALLQKSLRHFSGQHVSYCQSLERQP